MRKQVNVVVVDDNDAVTEKIAKYFAVSERINIVKCFNDGKEGLNYLLNNKAKYDLLILDVLLPNIDGIKILEELNKNNIQNKKVIVLSSFKDDYTIRKIQTLNANYYMLKPIDVKVLEDRILDLFENNSELQIAKSSSVEVRVSTLLHDLGIPSHVRGYKYIREGILILYTSNDLLTLVTKDIYPEIAHKYETTIPRVERSIRHAIEISWMRGDIKLMEDLFGNSIDFERSRPTNSEFLTTLADRIKLSSNELIG